MTRFEKFRANCIERQRLQNTVASANRRSRKQAGLTLIEGLSFLGVAGMVIGGALMLGNSANNSNFSNLHTAELTGLRQNVRQMYNGQGNFGSTTATYASLNSTMISGNKVPQSMFVSGTTITNDWGGSVVINGNNTQFYITTPSVPQDVCVTMVAAAIQQGWRSIGVGGAYPGTNSSSTAVTPATAATYCAAGGNTLYFTGV